MSQNETLTPPKKKYIVIMRHGERADYKGEIPKFGKFDTELTKRGQENSQKTGQILYNTLIQLGIPESYKIKIKCSPFIRAIQTAMNIKIGFNSLNENHKYLIDDTIEVNCKIAEINSLDLFGGEKYTNYLNSIRKTDAFLNEFGSCNLNILNNIEDLPKEIELISCKEEDLKTGDYSKIEKRGQEFLIKELNNLYSNDDCDILFIVTHGELVNRMNKYLNYTGDTSYFYIHYNYFFIFELNGKEHEKAKYLTQGHP